MPRASSWTDDQREKLIDLVMKNLALWQEKLPEYMRKDIKQTSWEKIAECFPLSFHFSTVGEGTHRPDKASQMAVTVSRKMVLTVAVPRQ